MADPRIVREWLDKDDGDFIFTRVNLEERENFYPQICFHFHQAAEKYLKSFIVAYDLEFEKMHNLMNLLMTCSSIDASSSVDPVWIVTAYDPTLSLQEWEADFKTRRSKS
jgi:HEPN domain-containing protein